MISQEKIIEAVQKIGVANVGVIDEVVKVAVKEGRPVQDVLIDRNIIKADRLWQLIANLYKVKFVDLAKESISEEVLRIIPDELALSKHVVAFKRDKGGLRIAMSDPDDYAIKKMLEKKTGESVIAFYAPEILIERVLPHYKKDIKKEFQDVTKINIIKSKGARAEDVSILKIVDSLIAYGHQNKASDMHIEPHRDDASVRFRVDGILHEVLTLPLNILDLIVTRIKILSKLRTDEHRASQDGKMITKVDKNEVDVRVSILPTAHGEKVVLRLLTPDERLTTLEELGFSSHDLKIVRASVDKPHGMILSTGPTGSGKTITLYSLLRIVNTREINIATIENPVEYELQGVNQVQVNSKTNLTFSSGLRSLLRQDPDVLMVGEIRDEETASIAINAAMTGHLVLSTLHTNDAATTLPRLYDMKIEPFLIASTVDLIIAQRLIRKICTRCISSYSVTRNELAKLFGSDLDVGRYVFEGKALIYKGKGCNTCNDTGYEGRVGVFEVMEMSDELRDHVVNKENPEVIREAARRQGMVSMLEDALEKVILGKTTIEEVIRVVKT